MKVIVPDTSADQDVAALAMGESGGIAAYVSFNGITEGIWVERLHAVPETAPTCQWVIDNGTPLIPGVPISLQPVQIDGTSAEQIDPALVFFAKSTAGSGDARIIW